MVLAPASCSCWADSPGTNSLHLPLTGAGTGPEGACSLVGPGVLPVPLQSTDPLLEQGCQGGAEAFPDPSEPW